MAKNKKLTIDKRILHFFFRGNRNIPDNANIREVYFGLRIRFLGLLVLVMFIIISILTLVMYWNQERLIEEERFQRAGALTKILGGPAEFYLDKEITTKKEELQLKYQSIERESKNYLIYNDDIVKILLTDYRGIIRFSTFPGDYRVKGIVPYIKDGLSQDDGNLKSNDFTINKKNPKTKKSEPVRYRAITYPVFLHKGDFISIINDYKRLYTAYRTSSKKRKDQIYKYLLGRHKEILGDDFDITKQKKQPDKKKGPADQIARAGDIDFLFQKLFSETMMRRGKYIPKNEWWLWNESWLFAQKKKIAAELKEENLSNAKKADDLIVSRIQKMSEQVEKIKRLGVLAILFNVDTVKKASAVHVKQAVNIAIIMMIICSIAFIVVLNFMIQNLKKLEQWAISVSAGNLDEKIQIATSDEIGRLGDISNYMIDEIKEKYHLEKFVSKSTKSMIKETRGVSNEINLGVTGRKNLAFIFSDVRGFTSFSERNDPTTVVEVLNFYLEFQSKIIKGNKGDINDYVGDQIMAHFSGEKRADRAIETAVKIMMELKRINAEREKDGLPVFEMGIGVHEGDVVVGNIGSHFRMDFACVGDAVNLTSRLCSSAKPGEILASQEIFDQATKKPSASSAPPIEVKGKEKKIQIVKIHY